jgi:uncharacterized protein DUF4258
MSILVDIKAAVAAGNYQITLHGAHSMADDGVTEAELLAATAVGDLIEDYPTAWPCPACLILGYGAAAKPLHAVWAFEPALARAILVTVYRPDPAQWSPDFRVRSKP